MKKYLIYHLLLLILVACTQVPLTGRKQFAPLPTSQMTALGESNYNDVLENTKLSDNEEQTAMVKNAGPRIKNAVESYLNQNGMENRIDGYEWEFNLFAEDQVNAWAMPGGKVGFFEGIMPICKNETGVAVVMSHEIGHVIASHGNERLSQGLATQMGGIALSVALRDKPQQTRQLALAAFGLGAQVGFLLPYSRLHESEADEMGLYFMAMAGYDPREAPKFWERMASQSGGGQPPEFLSTHPSHETRIDNLNKNMDKAMSYYRENN